MPLKRDIPWLTVVVASLASFSSGCDTSSLQKSGVSSSDSGTAGAGGGEDCASGPVAWQTPTVSFSARDFKILAGGQCYTSAGASVDVHSDPGNSTYTTLELIWTEHEREMRFFIYFSADPYGWWSDEMRTYDGKAANPDWLYYRGAFFKSPSGGTYTGDLDVLNGGDEDPLRGELILQGLQLSTTLPGV